MTEVLVIGGGVCGLRLAGLLTERGTRCVLAESRKAVGGRVRTLHHDLGYADLGPAWVWPHQPRVMALLHEHGLRTFEQHTGGRLMFQDERGSTRAFDMATMGGSLRLEGGLVRLTETLAQRLPPGVCWLGAHLRSLTRTDAGVLACFADGRTLETPRVVLALPPRIAATLVFEPELPAGLRAAMQDVPTWMAGHAKAIAIYREPFWRDRGLNGDAMSHCGPLAEIHDASSHDLSCGALFGFFGRPALWRRQHRGQLEPLVLDQLATLFGDEAARPQALHLIDWADDPRVATPGDAALLREHPRYGPLDVDLGPWREVLLLSGTELSPDEGGYIEGALAAAEAAAARL